MRIVLIGMSGIGKSYWAEKLEGAGFRRFVCDDLIADRLDDELGDEGDTIARLAGWMGFPYEKGYSEREDVYLRLENIVTAEVLDAACATEQDVVIDATGSLIHVDPELLERVRQSARVVYLVTPAAMRDKLRRDYLIHPRPLLWREHFLQNEGESGLDALRRCYPTLLDIRAERYARLADVTLDAATVRASGFEVEDFLRKVNASSP